MEDLIAELDAADSEHVDVAVADADGWTRSPYASGHLVWENEAGEPGISLALRVRRSSA